jgi:hypothetical protein
MIRTAPRRKKQKYFTSPAWTFVSFLKKRIWQQTQILTFCSKNPKAGRQAAAASVGQFGRLAGGHAELEAAALLHRGAAGAAARRLQREGAHRAVGRPRRQKLVSEHPAGAAQVRRLPPTHWPSVEMRPDF